MVATTKSAQRRYQLHLRQLAAGPVPLLDRSGYGQGAPEGRAAPIAFRRCMLEVVDAADVDIHEEWAARYLVWVGIPDPRMPKALCRERMASAANRAAYAAERAAARLREKKEQ